MGNPLFDSKRSTVVALMGLGTSAQGRPGGPKAPPEPGKDHPEEEEGDFNNDTYEPEHDGGAALWD
jgi:hypothetical protein